MEDKTLSSLIIGEESLLIQCADAWLGRGQEISGIVTRNTRIHDWASDHGIPTLAPGGDLAVRLADLNIEIDYLFSITNLRMLPEAVLGLARRGAINFHDGPLPRYAGLNAPVWALLEGETEYGVTWHVMEAGPDRGAILEQEMFAMAPDETALTLNTKCYEAGIRSFTALIDDLLAGRLAPAEQDVSLRSYYAGARRPPLGGTIGWREGAEAITRLVRASDFGGYANPVAVAKCWTGRELVRVTAAGDTARASTEPPGTVVAVDAEALVVATGTTDLRITAVASLGGAGVPLSRLIEGSNLAPGGRLPLLEGPPADSLDSLVKTTAPHEAWWAKRLQAARFPDLPLVDRASREGANYRTLEVAVPAATDADTLLVTTCAWLARLSGPEPVDVGYRDDALAESTGDLTPWFADHVPIRITVGPEESFADFSRSCAGERARVCERTSYPRDLIGRMPELRARYPGGEVRFPVAVTVETAAASAVGDELTVAIDPAGGRISWLYDSARLSDTAIRALARQYSALVEAAVSDPGRRCRTLPLLAAEDLDLVLREWNSTDRAVAEGRCIHHLIEEQAAATPDQPAVVAGGVTLSYAELDARANQVALLLRQRGVANEDLVGVCLDRSEKMMVALLGILKAGAAYVPLDPTYPTKRLEFMVADSHLGTILTEERHRRRLPESDAATICLDTDWSAVTDQQATAGDVAVDPSQLCYVIYTSGSTGTPKGVMVEHRNVVNFFAGMDESVGDGRDEGAGDNEARVWLAVTSLSFDISVLELFWTLARGYTVVLHAGEATAPVPAVADAPAPARAPAATTPIGFSLCYFAADQGEPDDKYRLLLDGARFADRHGFEAVWTPERHFHAFGGLYPNPSVTSSALAMITDRIAIRAGSVVLPLHHPVRVAEEWSVVDNLSGGRVGIAFASGWMPNDFLIRPEGYADKKQVMLRDMDVVRRLWRGEAIEFPGAMDNEVEVSILPKPIQAELPYWITTAGNPETFAAAGRTGANLLTHLLGQSVAELAEKLDAYRQARAEAGHEGPGHVTLMLHTFVSDDLDSLKETVREPLKSYLSTATSLVKQYAWSFPAFKKREGQNFDDIDLNSLSAEESDALMEHAFERYFETSGLFGTPQSCRAMVESIKQIGVDEIACLIDFGIGAETVLANLPHLAELKELAQPAAPAESRETVGQLIERHGVTHMQCTPSMATMLLADPGTRKALPRLRHLLIGGEAFPTSLADDLTAAGVGAVTNMYGPTETTIWSATHRLNGTRDGIPIGRPIANTELYILDGDGQPTPIGVPGELFIGGRGVVRGYLDRPELTAERFVANRLSSDAGSRLYRTGDVARYRDDGTVEFLGRMDHQVKVRGYRIELGEIETALARHPAVAEAVVVARGEGGGDDRRLVGYVVLRDGPAGVDELKNHLRATLPEFMVPGHIVALDRFPLTPNSKVDRNALPEPESVAAQSRDEEGAQPSSAMEQQLADLWREVLKVPRVGPEDNFFDLGGHSLLVVQAHRRLRDDLQVELSITDMFRFPTVRSLASFIEDGDAAVAGAREGVSRAAGRRAALKRRRGRRV